MESHHGWIELRNGTISPIQRRRSSHLVRRCGTVFLALQLLIFPTRTTTAWSTPLPSISHSHHTNDIPTTSRRELLQLGFVVASILQGSPSLAAEETEGMLSASAVAALLHVVPTFTIVDKKGVPFMVVGEDAKVTGYFFTEFGEAQRILTVARQSADKAIAEARREGKSVEEVGTNPWKMARISTIPLDSAVTLATKSLSSFGGRNYFRVAPSEQDIEDALTLTGQDDLAEGKVPLFYYADFTMNIDGEEKSPLFFRKSELEEQFRKKTKGTNTSSSSVDTVPPVLVTELFAVLGEMVKPGGNDTDLQKLIFIPPKESEQKRKECEKAGGNEAPFFVGQRIIVL